MVGARARIKRASRRRATVARRVADASYSPLTEAERDLGVVLLELVRDWGGWVHRRVESFEIEDERTVRRSVSVDFTLPRGHPHTEVTPAGEPRHVVPLGLMRKRPLRRFDLHDEQDTALPLLTLEQNSRAAAAMLTAMCEAYAYGAGLPPLPDEVAEDIWRLPRLAPGESEAVWQRLGQARGADEAVRSWRAAVALNGELMALAHDLAHSFLLLTPLAVHAGERRILKFAYEEQVVRARRPAAVLSWSRAREGVSAARGVAERESRRREEARAAGMGLLAVEAITHGVDGTARPEAGLRLRVEGQGTDEMARTDAAGRVLLSLPAGEYRVHESLSGGLLALTAPSQPATVKVGVEAGLRFEHRRVRASGAHLAGRPPELRPLRAARSLGLRRHWVEIPVPAIGHGASYHVDAEAPEGLQFVRTTLLHRPSYSDAQPTARDASESVAEHQSVQRTHLHLARVPQDSSGLLLLELLARPATVARAAALSAALTAVLLLLISLRLGAIGPNVGPVATLLLFASGPLSAYVARPREHRMTSVLVSGTRGLALLAGGAGLAGAALLLLQRDQRLDTSGAFEPGPAWSGTGEAMFALTLVAAACAVLSLASWWWVSRAERSVHPNP